MYKVPNAEQNYHSMFIGIFWNDQELSVVTVNADRIPVIFYLGLTMYKSGKKNTPKNKKYTNRNKM